MSDETKQKIKNAVPWLVMALCAACLAMLLYRAVVISSNSQLPAYWQGLRQWMTVTLVAFLLANVIFFTVRQQFKNLNLDPALLFSTFWAVSAAVALLLTIFYIYPDDLRRAHAFLCVAGGCVVGWALGMYISPQDSSEQTEFVKIGKVVAGVVSGYTLKGFQEWIFKGENQHYHIYCLLIFVSAVLTMATIYNVRAYGRNRVVLSFDHQDAAGAGSISAKVADVVSLRAAVYGPDDTSVQWSVISDPADPKQSGKKVAEITSDGKFSWNKTDLPDGGKCRVRAESSANPRLVDIVDVTVTA